MTSICNLQFVICKLKRAESLVRSLRATRTLALLAVGVVLVAAAGTFAQDAAPTAPQSAPPAQPNASAPPSAQAGAGTSPTPAATAQSGTQKPADTPTPPAPNQQAAPSTAPQAATPPATPAQPGATTVPATPAAGTPTVPSAAGFEISGAVKSGTRPLPGVTVTAAHSLTGKKVTTSTDLDGTYKLSLPNKGKWVVRAEMPAFAVQTSEVSLKPEAPAQKADFTLTLLSRVPKQEGTQGLGNINPQQLANAIANARGQRLNVTADESALSSVGGSAGGNGDMPANVNALANSADAANQSVSVAGQMGSTQDFGLRTMEDMRDRLDDLRAQGRLGDGNAGFGGGRGGFGGPGGGGPGGGGGPMMILAGPGGGGLIGGAARMQRFNINRPHGTVYYSAGNSFFDAAPYSLSGAPAGTPDYGSNRFGAFVGGPLEIPHVYHGGTKTFYFAGYNGSRASTPYDVFSHVPTAAERQGDFSDSINPSTGQLVQLFNPLASPGCTSTSPGRVCTVPISSTAQGLLGFIPLPNQPGQQNFRFSDSQNTGTDTALFRLTHNFGDMPIFGGGGRGGGGGGRGGRTQRPHNNVNLGGNFFRSHGDQLRPFGTTSGNTNSDGYNVNAGWAYGTRSFNNNVRVTWNANKITTSNLFTGVTDIAGQLGIVGASTNPADFALPSISFANFRGLSDVAPQHRLDRTLSFSESVNLPRRKHNFRVGGDYRRLFTSLRSNSNPSGSFIFTGFATATTATPGSGYDFADFLLGLPQQTSIQFSPFTYHFVANSWDGFVQDDWRIRSDLTIELGLRYEYNGPYTETSGHLVNLDASENFTAVAPVQPGQVGPFTGAFPDSLVHPDRNNFAPRIGIAWRTKDKFVLRAGYGVNYNLGQYRAIVSQLSQQPPFAFTQTNTSSQAAPLTFSTAFPPPTAAITNNFGVDPNYALGYVQVWNLNIQRELPGSTVLNVGYTGSKGTHLDIVRAPNRGPDGLRIPDVQPFLWESSEGSSIMHQATVRLRRRMHNGVSVGGTYVFSKSIDNASSIGGGATVVAQNDLDLAAERGLSSFDQRHRFTGDYVVELPFGTGKAFLNNPGALSKILGNWMWSGDFTVASGTPFTARVVGDIADVARGVNGTLRADYNGLPIGVSDPTVAHFFNTAAFTVPPFGTFGDAGRNTIIGPGNFVVDMAVSKTFPMKDLMGLEVRAEAVNVFNHANFTAIDTSVNSPTFGQVISVGNMRRMQFTSRFRF